MAQRIIEEMADKYPWPQLNRTATITLVAGQADYELPGDFSRYHYETFWNSSTNWAVIGPMSEIEYAQFLGNATPAQTAGYFIFRASLMRGLLMWPTPGSGEAGETILFDMFQRVRFARRHGVEGLSINAGDYCSYNGILLRAIEHWSDWTDRQRIRAVQRAME